jgi:hypothetical protein
MNTKQLQCSRRERTPLQKKILETKAKNPEVNNTDLAKIVGATREHVSKILSRYGIDYGALESYQNHRADILDGLAHRIIESVTDSDIKAASLLQRLSAYGIVYDKMRVEKGLSDSSTKPLVQVNIVAANGASVSLGEQGKGEKP